MADKNRLIEWLDVRTGLWDHPPGVIKAFLERLIPRGVNWAYTLGSATLTTFLVLLVTGILLTMHYQPAPEVAHSSLQYLDSGVLFGHFIRNLHHWGASVMVVLVAAHMTRVFYYGAYKYPRELTWLTGCLLLAFTLAYAFTGYLLPWDQKAYWTTILLSRMAQTAPFFGNLARVMIQGGPEFTGRTLTRFYAFHTWILTAIALLFVGTHIGLVVRQGISNPPRRTDEPYADAPDPKEAYDRFYLARKKAGEPFYFNIVEDSLVSLLVVVVLFAMALFLKNPLGDPADPIGVGFAPRPEWYFAWLFQLLRYFPGKLEAFGVIGMPGLVGLLLILVPFLDRGPRRHPLGRPITVTLWTLAGLAVAWLTWAGVTQPIRRPTAAGAPVPVAKPFSPQGLAGWKVFNANGCVNCHQVGNAGTPVGPNLTDIGGKRDRAYLTNWVRNPQAVKPGAGMPPFPNIPEKEYQDLITFLSELK